MISFKITLDSGQELTLTNEEAEQLAKLLKGLIKSNQGRPQKKPMVEEVEEVESVDTQG